MPAFLEYFNKLPQASNLIVSFTSFPARMKYLEFTLFSLVRQTIRPQKIILWLSGKEFPGKENDIPKNIKRYYPFGFEIHFIEENYKSFKKLMYTLQNYPEHIIITADDDVFYKKTWIELLYKTHKDFPNDIIAHNIHKITFTDKKIDPYLKWKNCSKGARYFNFAVGYGGILYPPHSLHKDAVNPSLFLELCPNADDVWFYVTAIANNTKIRATKNIFSKTRVLDYQLNKEYEEVPQLTNINWINNKNDLQLEAALKHYNLYDNFFETVTQ